MQKGAHTWPTFRKCCQLLLLSGVTASLVFIGGCAHQPTPEEIHDKLSIFFDGVPRPGEKLEKEVEALGEKVEDLEKEVAVIKKQRGQGEKGREEPSAPGAPAPSREAEAPIEGVKDWQEAARLLPKDSTGRVDWDQALKTGIIKPRSGIGANAPEQAVLEFGVNLASAGKFFSVTLSHGAHTRWLACGSCHPAVFPLRRQAEPTVVTMAKIDAGQYCGACHGTVAFRVEGRCVRCHTKIPATGDWRPSEEPRKPIERVRTWEEAAKLLPAIDGEPDWVKALADGVVAPRPGVDPKGKEEEVLDLDIERTPEADEASKVVFPHAPHTAWLACTNCHPALFQEEAGATPMSMEKIEGGQSCGACHGKGVAFSVDACGRCHPAM